jgi:pilus assembly protein Flp/PilA
MKTFKKLIQFLQSRSGATAMEYALIGGIICIAVVGGATALGDATNDSFTRVNEQVPWGG